MPEGLLQLDIKMDLLKLEQKPDQQGENQVIENLEEGIELIENLINQFHRLKEDLCIELLEEMAERSTIAIEALKEDTHLG